MDKIDFDMKWRPHHTASLEIQDKYPMELYDWEDFMEYFPIMQGNLGMHPIFWEMYYNYEVKIKTIN